MELVVILALVLSIVFFLLLGFKYGKKNKTLSDIFPIYFGKNASVDTVEEFSSTSIATTVSLATIIMAYFELVGYFGLFLLWTTVTTALGMILLSKMSKRILDRMEVYDHRPTLHEFLGTEYNNKTIAFIGALCTSIGFLLIAALELIVGSQFLAQLIPSINPTITAIVLSLTGIIYLSVGGFKTVVRSDVWQMKFIWLLIIAFFSYFILTIFNENNLLSRLNNIPKTIYNFSDRTGIWMFLIGIAVMNIPTHLSNQAMFQRINASQSRETVIKGLKQSIKGVFLSWALIVIIACLAYMFVPEATPNHLLTDLLKYISQTTFGKFVVFVVTIGMYSALLSTASTNLVVVGHTLSEDVFAKYKNKTLIERDNSKNEFNNSRLILLFSGIFSVVLVEGLNNLGFDIKDLVFSIYGGALALFPPILFSLFYDRNLLKKVSKFAIAGIVLGFFIGWGIAFYGKLSGNSNLIFLSPTFSIVTSFLLIIIGFLAIKKSNKE